MGFEPRHSSSVIRNANHYTTGAGLKNELIQVNDKVPVKRFLITVGQNIHALKLKICSLLLINDIFGTYDQMELSVNLPITFLIHMFIQNFEKDGAIFLLFKLSNKRFDCKQT